MDCGPHNLHFNPRSREGSDLRLFYKKLLGNLFQSTLPRGERQKRISIRREITQFQSTLPRGERQQRDVRKKILKSFQSTLPRGERRSGISLVDRPCPISIHAPARGATEHRKFVRRQEALFQSTLPRGERLPLAFEYKILPEFQSTLPRGERPRPGLLRRRLLSISIHAPARGATRARPPMA